MARPEQTEKATPKHRAEARSKGQVARSADLSGAFTFLAAIMMIHFSLFPLIGQFARGMRWTLEQAARKAPPTIDAGVAPYMGWVPGAVLPIAFMLLIVMIVGVVINVLQVGFHPSGKALQPNFSRLNPLNGLKRLFSPAILFQLGKQILKLTLVFFLVYDGLKNSLPQFLALSDTSMYTVVKTVDDMAYGLGLRFGGFMLAIGLADFFWERHRLEDSLKMTKNEVRDEQKQQEGSREAKGVFRRRQRELSRRRMMSSVPTATVVVTNPTHFAVALRYEDATMDAPIVVAKGADLLARRIREVAREHGVPTIENPPLARALYRDVEIDGAVPSELYAAVAKVIAFVYALRARPTDAERVIAHASRPANWIEEIPAGPPGPRAST